MKLYYILDGHTPVPCDDPMEFARWFEEADRQVGDDEVDGHRVSTVFLGINHAFTPGPPILFETMIFPESELVGRYSTWDDAEAGHRRAVEDLRRRPHLVGDAS